MKKLTNFKNSALLVASLSAVNLVAFSPSSFAKEEEGFKHYVTDVIQIPFRSGPSYKYKISRMIKSGSAVTVLEVNKDKWARVEYINGKGRKYTGWMPSSLLQNQPVARVQLKEEVAKTAQLEQEKIQLSEEIDTLKQRLQSTQEDLDSINKETFELKQEHKRLKEVSGNAVTIGEQNDALNQQVTELQIQSNLYKEQLDQAEDVVERQWFLTGGGVLLLGIILGLFFRTPKRKKRWDSL